MVKSPTESISVSKYTTFYQITSLAGQKIKCLSLKH